MWIKKIHSLKIRWKNEIETKEFVINIINGLVGCANEREDKGENGLGGKG